MASSPAEYIIIGGGTSGLVVLVLEAGKDLSSDPTVNIPAFWTSLMGSDADWKYKTLPQKGLLDRRIQQPQGKALGGSSAINGQAFIAPAQSDIDAWETLGNPGWNWDSLVSSYKKSYTLTSPEDQATLDHLGIDWIDDKYRGKDGPVQVSFPGVKENPLCKAWIDAFRGLNKATDADPFSGNSIGGYSNAATVDRKEKIRGYAYSAYGALASQRPNVRILADAAVHRINFADTKGDILTATGVTALVDGKLETLTAKAEIILAAGVFNTPKLLELSGIGSERILDRHGITSRVNLPGVGENLQDHLMTGMSYEVEDGFMTGDPLLRQEEEALAMAIKLYQEDKVGPFTIGGMQSHGFMPTPDAAALLDKLPQTKDPKEMDHCNVVRSILEDPNGTSGGWLMFPAQTHFHQNADSFVGDNLLPQNFASLGCVQSRPFSRGSTHISSSDIDAIPDIDPRYFSHPSDLEILARHIQAIDTKLRRSVELAPYFKPDGARNHPDAKNVDNLDGAKKYVLDTATTAYHGCGSAAMLPRDKGGVVDSRLVVYGTKNLRIVDASIFPLIPRGNPMSSVYAVAEKAADIIKDDRNL
ncbi:putative GMC oxidoreductase [Xylariaceae sp. FL0016]|nr:putative GMC oxidoreductase [Xylariaceae sp. FL0016]